MCGNTQYSRSYKLYTLHLGGKNVLCKRALYIMFTWTLSHTGLIHTTVVYIVVMCCVCFIYITRKIIFLEKVTVPGLYFYVYSKITLLAREENTILARRLYCYVTCISSRNVEVLRKFNTWNIRRAFHCKNEGRGLFRCFLCDIIPKYLQPHVPDN